MGFGWMRGCGGFSRTSTGTAKGSGLKLGTAGRGAGYTSVLMGEYASGWYPDPHNHTLQRYHDGTEWTEHRAPAVDRTAILQAVLVQYTGSNVQVVAQSPYSATLVNRANPQHVLHLILTLLTCGLWLLVWLIVAASTHDTTMRVFVDEQGKVIWS